ncbi:hypothetical protein [Hydrogenophaga sp.]|nr:hypothetical protein [Hydrogenophaga sp.]
MDLLDAIGRKSECVGQVCMEHARRTQAALDAKVYQPAQDPQATCRGDRT